MVRVLALHGYGQSAEIFKQKMNAITKACGKDVEFVFLDAPIMLNPADLLDVNGSAQAFDTIEAPPDMPELQPRAWWTGNSDETVYYRLPEMTRYLKNYLKNERFDGVLGFSQGCGMAAILALMLERPESYPPFLLDGKAPHPPLKFCVLVSAFRPTDNVLGPLFNTPLTTPSLHVLGRKDATVPLEKSYTLVRACVNPRVEVHEGGHFVPSKGTWPTFFKDYFLSFDPVMGGKPVASPTQMPGGEPPSVGTLSKMSCVKTPSKL
ncbi:hypothetical protein BDV93DRAFT_524636 [Ceratobasidium sp. AG-I]|nr:hypothetical protein BDV93DRAFT_524636 [Ceratobasidium sp. AG-I]